MEAHTANARSFEIPVVVAVNVFITDTATEIDLDKRVALGAGAFAAVCADPWGGADRDAPSWLRPSWRLVTRSRTSTSSIPLNRTIEAKISTIATEIYGALFGAGFIYPIVGTMRTTPGLGTTPAFTDVDVDEEGIVVGVF